MWYKFNEKTFEVTPCKVEEASSTSLWQVQIENTNISTVFLGLNHDYIKEKSDITDEKYNPLVFETMVFSDIEDIDQLQYRSRTYKEAMLKHLAVVRGIKKRYANNK